MSIDDLEEFPPYDGTIDLSIWKAQRARALKTARNKASTMLTHTAADGSPLYALTSAGNFRRTSNFSPATRAKVLERDGNACVWCGSPGPFEVDHIIRYVDGGSNDADNLQTLCEPCHRSKGGQ